MSCNGSDVTVEKPKECKDASSSDSIIYKSKETPVNPSVQDREIVFGFLKTKYNQPKTENFVKKSNS